jgi:hypothetical protein
MCPYKYIQLYKKGMAATSLKMQEIEENIGKIHNRQVRASKGVRESGEWLENYVQGELLVPEDEYIILPF